MKPNPHVSVVIPALNEENRLPSTLTSAIEYLNRVNYPSEIILVTDGSRDGTFEIAKSYQITFPHIRALDLENRMGKGHAVRRGMLEARGDFRLFMDADGAVPIHFLGEFLERAKAGRDIVVASRAHADSMIEARQHFFRNLSARAFGRLQRSVLRLPIRDTQCGFKLFTRRAAEFLFPRLQYDCSYFDAELLYMALHAGFTIDEVGVTWRHDGETRLPIGFRRTLDLVKKLFLIPRLHPKHSLQGIDLLPEQTAEPEPEIKQNLTSVQ